MTSLYSHDITLVLFLWIIKQIIRKNILSLETAASLLRAQQFLQFTNMLSICQVKFWSCLVGSCNVWSGLIWPCLVWSGHVWIYRVMFCLVMSAHAWSCLVGSCNVWSDLAMSSLVMSGLVMSGHIWSCLVMPAHALSCLVWSYLV